MVEKMKLNMDSAAGKEMNYQKISVVSDQMDGVHCSDKKQKSNSFIVDIEGVATRAEKEYRTPSSRIIRNFSRKGSIRGVEKMANLNQTTTESPRGSPNSPKTPMALVTVENHVSSDHHHHVTITTTDSETRVHARRLNSTRRPQSAFTIDPRKVLFVFASLSSLGSLLLIYFTLAIKKMNEESKTLYWQ